MYRFQDQMNTVHVACLSNCEIHAWLEIPTPEYEAALRRKWEFDMHLQNCE